MTKEEILTVLENAKLHAAFERDVEILDACMSAMREQEANLMALKAACSTLEQYIDAEKEGRMILLPCKEGTTVYTIRWWDDVPETCTDSRGKKFQRMIREHKVTKEKFAPFGLDYTQFGIKVFLTREEAEKALRELEEK